MKPIRASTRSLLWLLGAVIICVFTARSAKADVIWGASGYATGGDGPISAQADFAISNGQIQVTITNLVGPTVIRDVAQTVSGLTFTISNAPGTDTGNTAAGSLVKFNRSVDGSVTGTSGTPGRWLRAAGGFNISGDTITLEATGAGWPAQLILPAAGDGDYSNMHKVITHHNPLVDGLAPFPNINHGFTSHNPYVDGPATFTLDLADVTSSTTVTAVTFSFGACPETCIDGTYLGDPPSSAPEPTSLTLLVISAASGLLVYDWRRRRLAI